MVLSTAQLRNEYKPACANHGNLYLAAYAALNAAFRVHGYAVRREDTGAYNCRTITGGSAYSLHAYGPADRFTFWTGVTIATSLAVDVNWKSNPYGPRLVTDMPRPMIDAIYRIRTRSGAQVWRWGGYYTNNKDAMHFEIVCSKADLATGIDPATVPGVPAPEPKKDITMLQLIIDGNVWLVGAAPGPISLGGQPDVHDRLVKVGVPVIDGQEAKDLLALVQAATPTGGGAGGGPSAAEIAKAVNDDQARRLEG